MTPLLIATAFADSALSVGHYGAELWVSSATKTAVFGEIRGQSVSWLLVDITDQDGQLWQQHTTCTVELLDSTGNSRAALSPSFISSLPVLRYPIQTTDGYRADIGLEHVGYDPTYSLPTRADTPGVIDWDEDGNPGATITLNIPLLGNVELYIAQRAQMILTGQVLASGQVRGGLELPIMEQQTLGASVGFLDRSPPIRPLPEESGFAMLLLPEGSGCAAIKPTLCTAGVARTESCAR